MTEGLAKEEEPLPTANGPVVTSRAPGRPKMPFDRIIDAALDIVDEGGADALTFRALADRLGSSTATLYRHLDSRADLLGQVVDRVLGEVDVDASALAGLEWSEACRRLATDLFEAVARHPNAAPLLVETVPTGPHAMALRERTLAVLLAHDFDPATARTFTATLGHFVIGFAMQLRRDGGGPAADVRAGLRLTNADPARFPATRATATTETVPLAEEFALGIDLLLRGMRDAPSPNGRTV